MNTHPTQSQAILARLQTPKAGELDGQRRVLSWREFSPLWWMGLLIS